MPHEDQFSIVIVEPAERQSQLLRQFGVGDEPARRRPAPRQRADDRGRRFDRQRRDLPPDGPLCRPADACDAPSAPAPRQPQEPFFERQFRRLHVLRQSAKRFDASILHDIGGVERAATRRSSRKRHRSHEPRPMFGNKPIERRSFARGRPPQQIVVRRWLQNGLRRSTAACESATGIRHLGRTASIGFRPLLRPAGRQRGQRIFRPGVLWIASAEILAHLRDKCSPRSWRDRRSPAAVGRSAREVQQHRHAAPGDARRLGQAEQLLDLHGEDGRPGRLLGDGEPAAAGHGQSLRCFAVDRLQLLITQPALNRPSQSAERNSPSDFRPAASSTSKGGGGPPPRNAGSLSRASIRDQRRRMRNRPGRRIVGRSQRIESLQRRCARASPRPLSSLIAAAELRDPPRIKSSMRTRRARTTRSDFSSNKLRLSRQIGRRQPVALNTRRHADQRLRLPRVDIDADEEFAISHAARRRGRTPRPPIMTPFSPPGFRRRANRSG